MSKEAKPKLTEEEIKKLIDMDYRERDRWYPRGDDLEKLKNTIEALEEDLASTKGIQRFITPGVLVNDSLVLCAAPDDYRTNIKLRAFSDTSQVAVDISIEEAERMKRLLTSTIQAAKKKRDLIRLKGLLKEKTTSRY